MRITLASLLGILFLFSCKQKDATPESFTVNATIKNAASDEAYLEELYFDNTPPLVLDTATVKDGKFSLSGTGKEEGMYRIRFKGLQNGYLFINDAKAISFNADMADSTISGASFSSPANKSFTGFLDSMSSYRNQFMQAAMGIGPVDSSHNLDPEAQKEMIALKAKNYVVKFLDTVKSPTLATFVMGFTQDVDTAEMRKLTGSLKKRFPNHGGVNTMVSRYDQMLAEAAKPQQQQSAKQKIGALAPELTMNDVNGKPVSISSFKGKYVLVDFWASWCGPCRRENPNIVAAYNKFKDKNFTILGVSLDENKDAWVQAIAKDKLTWSHMSDLKGWGSAASTVYGVDAIPYNVLLDPEGKIIASELHGPGLEAKLAEVLK